MAYTYTLSRGKAAEKGCVGSPTLAGPWMHATYRFFPFTYTLPAKGGLISRDLPLRPVDFFCRDLHVGAAAGFPRLVAVAGACTYSLLETKTGAK